MSKATEKPAPETKGFWNKLCIIPGRLDNKLAIVTGANTGIGFYTTSELARRGCQVIMACRSQDRAEAARNAMLEKYGQANPNCLNLDVAGDEVKSSLSAIRPEQLIIENLDLASLKSIRDFVQRFTSKHTHLDYLINNAGLVSSEYIETEDKFEKTLGTNHLGHFLLTELLLPLLKQSGPARIILVSSMAHTFGNLNRPDLQITKENYGLIKAYVQSKLANTTYAKELSRRLAETQVIAVSLHPGVVQTEIGRDFVSGWQKAMATLTKPFSISAWTGAQTTLYTVLSSKLVSGGYYSNCALKQPAQAVLSEDNQDWLRQKSCELVGLSLQ